MYSLLRLFNRIYSTSCTLSASLMWPDPILRNGVRPRETNSVSSGGIEVKVNRWNKRDHIGLINWMWGTLPKHFRGLHAIVQEHFRHRTCFQTYILCVTMYMIQQPHISILQWYLLYLRGIYIIEVVDSTCMYGKCRHCNMSHKYKCMWG